MITGIVTGYEIGPNQNGTKDVVLLQVRITDKDDIQKVELMTNPGNESIPSLGARVTILQAGPSWKIAIAASDNITPDVEAGEKKIYSQENDSIKAFILLLKSGIIHINGDNDFAVRFTALETGFNQLKSDFNGSLIHIHSGVTTGGGVSGPPTPPTVPSAADISGAKVNEVKII